MAEKQTAASVYQKCIFLFNDIRELIEVHAPRSLPTSRKIELRHVGEKLEAWHGDILSFKPDEKLDQILERSTHYIGKVRSLLEGIHDVLSSIYLLLSSPQGSSEDSRAKVLKSAILSLKELYDELADDDDIAALKASPEFASNSLARQFDRPASSSKHEGRALQGFNQPERATTDLHDHLVFKRDPAFTLQYRSTMGTASEGFRRKSSSAVSQALKEPVVVASGSGTNPLTSTMSLEFTQPPCEAARDKLVKIGVRPSYSNRGGGPPTIFPAQDVKRILSEDDTAEKVFHCGCSRCYSHSRIIGESRHFDKESLTEKFATTFALLISLYRSGLICHFQKEGKCLTDGGLERENLRFISELQVPTPDSSHIAIDEIIRDQHMFHLKQFEVWHHSVKLGPDEALPITELQEEGRGAYGTVYSFTFLSGYAGRGYEIFDPQKFARKVFVKSNVTSGIDEFNNLLRIYRKGTSQSTERWAKWRKHIMEALAGYEHGDIYFIVFPFAESTLAKYFREETNQAKLTPRFMWRQMEGIAGGLAFLHESYLSTTGNDIVSPSIAFHFDLKPENILIRNGVVMISDFGQSKFRKASLGDSSFGVDSDRVFFNYGPPEHNFSTYDKGAKKKSNYNFDIWSLGGIFSELITFHVKQPAGKQGFLDYRNARRQDDRDAGSRGIVTTFFLDESRMVKPSVVEQHDQLQSEIKGRSDPGYDGKRDLWLEDFAGGDFFTLVSDMLSVISETKQRPKAVEVQETLGRLCQKADLAADRLPTRNVPLQGRSDIWQQAKNGILWDFLPKSFNQILCYYVTQGSPEPTRCVILMQRLVNRQMQMLLLWHYGRSQYIQRQQEPISHTSIMRQTGVIIDYFGHPPSDVEPVDMLAETPPDKDEVQLDEELMSCCYKVVPVTNGMKNCAALLFVNARDAFSFQAALTGQHVVSNFSAVLQGAEIIPPNRKFGKRHSPEHIDQEALLQIWSDIDISSLPKPRDSTLSASDSPVAFDRVPTIHVAIITRRTLYLFKAGLPQIVVPAVGGAQTRNPILLRSKSTLSLDRIDLQARNGAVMVNIPEPDKYAKCEEARLRVGRYQDATLFWSTLEDCQRLWADIEMTRRNNGVRRIR
ncbi:hypothetical protein QTJ16_000378 [Diplocarpon rosae]|uniref:Protein kinase domain-containing protein n=1 Tax=Diplocarpon rosae TaxID=946125 RepID=A0AAD9T3W8_9HELO|nr:hypothetical protein QTJ16_000378 [Diplocarpon rosae]